MAGVQLYDYQYEALRRMRNGCILNGGVGSGKSRTSIAYYYELNGGEVNTPKYIPMKTKPKDLYIITTARKRDTLEWEEELTNFLITPDKTISRYKHKVFIDSWNNIGKYINVKDSFFIFDEQRVIGYGAWTKSFLKIVKSNEWILLSATPGDTWSDYIPVFIANGFFKHKTDFERKHAVFSRFTKYPKIEKYINEGRLIKMRNYILIDMKFERTTVPHHNYIITEYDRLKYNFIATERWNIYDNCPIKNASEFCFNLRKLVNSDTSRLIAVLDIVEKHPKAIIFYSYDYELKLLRKTFNDAEYPFSEWNGHLHEPIPSGDKWVYLVQYTAGCEGWNCIETDTIIFYSQNYSYRIMHQASGRIDRLNTPFTDLYYYHLRSNSKIDLAIRDAVKRKKKFNENGFSPIFKKE